MTRHGPIVMYFSGLNTQMHHSWENLRILSPWDSVPWDIVLHGFLSSWDFVRLDIVLWVFVHWDFVIEPNGLAFELLYTADVEERLIW